MPRCIDVILTLTSHSVFVLFSIIKLILVSTGLGERVVVSEVALAIIRGSIIVIIIVRVGGMSRYFI